MEESTKKGYGFKDYEILRVENIDEILKVVYDFDNVFKPSLSQRLSDLDAYAEKLYKNAIVYIAKGEDILGFTAFYANDKINFRAYIAETAVKPVAQGKRIGQALLNKCIETSMKMGMCELKMEVDNNNTRSINLHKKNGFEFCGEASLKSMYMIKQL